MQAQASFCSPLMTIGELAARHKVSFRTLRFYEEKGLLRPERENSTRLYGAADEIRLKLILKGKRFGFSLKEISDMIAESETKNSQAQELVLTSEVMNNQIVRLEQRREEVTRAIDELQLALA